MVAGLMLGLTLSSWANAQIDSHEISTERNGDVLVTATSCIPGLTVGSLSEAKERASGLVESLTVQEIKKLGIADEHARILAGGFQPRFVQDVGGNENICITATVSIPRNIPEIHSLQDGSKTPTSEDIDLDESSPAKARVLESRTLVDKIRDSEPMKWLDIAGNVIPIIGWLVSLSLGLLGWQKREELKRYYGYLKRCYGYVVERLDKMMAKRSR